MQKTQLRLCAGPWILVILAIGSLSGCQGASGGGGGGGQNGLVFPNIQVLSASSGPVGASITITGTNFGATQGNSTVTFNGTVATSIQSWSAGNITVLVPSGATTGNVIVTIPEVTTNGTPVQVPSNSVMFTVTAGAAPSITSINPNSGPVGATVVVTGSNFGATQGTGGVRFSGALAPAPLISWSATSITVTVPSGAITGSLDVLTSTGVVSNTVPFTVTATPPAPNISSLNPTSGAVGTTVTITGTNFGASQETSTVTFTGAAATSVTSWSATSIVVTVPVAATTGPVIVTVGGSDSNGSTFTVTGAAVCPLPALGNESKFNGVYSGIVDGWNDPTNGIQGPFEAAAAWHANGSGTLLAGERDAGQVAVGPSATEAAPAMMTFTGCYNLGGDLRGRMVWNFSAGGTVTFAIAVRADGAAGRVIEFDDLNPSTSPGTRNAGYFELETPVTATNAPVAFSLAGWGPNGGINDYRRSAAIGVISNNIVFGSPTASNGSLDFAITNGATSTQSNIDNQAFTATFSSYDSLGRGTAVVHFADVTGLCGTPPCPLTLNFAYYLADPGRFFLQSTDVPDSNGHSLGNGEAIPQSGLPFSNASLTRAVFQVTGGDLSANHNFNEAAAGMIVNSSGAVSVNLDFIRSGAAITAGTNAITGGSISINSNGMGSVTIGSSTAFSSAPAAFSVAMYGPNAGFIMEGTQASVPTPNTILLGDFGPQTVPSGGFVDTSFSGLSIFGTDHPANPSSQDVVGSWSTPSPQTSPASFSGKEDSSSGGAGCSTLCLSTGQASSGTYAVNANGRFPISLSPTFVTTIGWLRDSDSGQADKNAVILTNSLVSGVQSAFNTVLKVIQ